MSTFFDYNGKGFSSGSSSSSIIYGGAIANGGALPSPITAGDTIFLMGVSDHSVAVNKEIVAPVGYTEVRRWALPDIGGQYIPDTLLVSKVATGSEGGVTVSFTGDICRGIHYLIVRGVTAVTTGDNVYSYSSTPLGVPSVNPPATGIHAIMVVASNTNTTITTPPASYAQWSDTTPGYGRGGLFTLDNAPDPTPVVDVAGSNTPSMHAMSWYISL